MIAVSSRSIVAIDIGGGKIAVLARELTTGRKSWSNKLKTPATEGGGAILRLIDAEIDKIPGRRAGNLKGWGNVPLRALLEERYGVPISVEQDANCGALGEKWCGAATDMKSFVFPRAGNRRGRRALPGRSPLPRRPFRRGRRGAT